MLYVEKKPMINCEATKWTARVGLNGAFGWAHDAVPMLRKEKNRVIDNCRA